MTAPPSITIAAAIAQSLGQQGAVVFTRHELAQVVWRICQQSHFNGQPLRPHKDALSRAAFNRHEATLLQQGLIKPVPGLPQGAAYSLVGASVADARVLACAVDPFCYVSHLSAMEFHGLTDRMPEQLYVSSPATMRWREFAAARMQKDLGTELDAFLNAGLPAMQRTKITKLAGRPVHLASSLHLGAFRHIKDQHIRVSTLGRTYLDMLHEPQLCGGLSHVLAVFKVHAPLHLRLILDEIDQHGSGIDKVRAGFILEDICKITDARIDAWTAHAQRGGSRKLDARGDYSATFSERWALSINVPLGDE